MYTAFVFVNGTILLTLSSQMATAASNIYWFFSLDVQLTNGECMIAFTSMIAVLLLPLTQLRYLHSLTLMNIVNIACMLIFVGITVYFLVLHGRWPNAKTEIGPYWTGIAGNLSLATENQSGPILGIEFLFSAYYYQTIILEIMAEMKDPSQFPKANYWSTPLVIFVTLVTSTTQYYYLGEYKELTDVQVTEVLESIFDFRSRGRNAVAYIGVICFSVHMIGCCVIKSIVLTRSLQLLINPKVANKSGWRARLEWVGISFGVLALAWTLTLFLNNFGLISVFTGFLTLVTTIILPIVLYLICCRKGTAVCPKREWVLIGFILVFSIGVMVVNLIKIGQRFGTTGTTGDKISNITLTELERQTSCSDFKF